MSIGQAMVTEIEKIEDFTLLLLLHIANVDGSVHPNEKETIIDRMKDLFPAQTNFNTQLDLLESTYRNLGHDGSEALLLENMPKFASLDTTMRMQIYSALFDIINANGRVNTEETDVLKVFKSWLVS